MKYNIIKTTFNHKHHPPALLVSTVNKFSICVLPSFNPLPVTLTFFASPTSRSPTVILKGELTMCWPIRFTDTTCWPISLGVNDIPENVNA